MSSQRLDLQKVAWSWRNLSSSSKDSNLGLKSHDQKVVSHQKFTWSKMPHFDKKVPSVKAPNPHLTHSTPLFTLKIKYLPLALDLQKITSNLHLLKDTMTLFTHDHKSLISYLQSPTPPPLNHDIPTISKEQLHISWFFAFLTFRSTRSNPYL